MCIVLQEFRMGVCTEAISGHVLCLVLILWLRT